MKPQCEQELRVGECIMRLPGMKVSDLLQAADDYGMWDWRRSGEAAHGQRSSDRGDKRADLLEAVRHEAHARTGHRAHRTHSPQNILFFR